MYLYIYIYFYIRISVATPLNLLQVLKYSKAGIDSTTDLMVIQTSC